MVTRLDAFGTPSAPMGWSGCCVISRYDAARAQQTSVVQRALIPIEQGGLDTRFERPQFIVQCPSVRGVNGDLSSGGQTGSNQVNPGRGGRMRRVQSGVFHMLDASNALTFALR